MLTVPRPDSRRLIVNGNPVLASRGETILQAALRAGLPFPHSCRVGGCATCRCRIVDGTVHERTSADYLLSREELANHTVLACQSVPTSDLVVEVDVDRVGGHGLPGRVVAREALTKDIARVDVQLDAPLRYRPGQYATLSLEGVPGIGRCYSFATPPQADGRASFLVRRVDGGALSPTLVDGDIVGKRVRVDGPSGGFWLRPDDGSLLFVATGSGLAPIHAILKAAVDAGEARDAVLLFGARTSADLLLWHELELIASQWSGRFTLIPVLSQAESDWAGARGHVNDHVAAHATPMTQAYLCGAPAMVDGVAARLTLVGMPAGHIHADRFTDAHDAAAAAAAEVQQEGAARSAFHYLKFFGFHAIGLFSVLTLLAGGPYVVAGLLSVITFYVLGDALGGDDLSTPRYRWPAILTGQLWLGLPMLLLIVFTSVWSVCEGDPLGFGALLSQASGVDLLLARAMTTTGQHVAGFVLTGLMIGMVGTITAHELTHRTWDPISMWIGRWMLAFSGDTTFAIEHVYGHHRYVATQGDPATAPRGRNVYAHIVASTIKGNVSAWCIEKERLARRGRGVWSLHNRFLAGHAMSVALVGLAGLMGGLVAAAYFVACAAMGKALLEIVNYMEHYGLVRDPTTPVQPRHSWNTNRCLSSWTMFNLTRHSHHHADGEVPYHALRPLPDAPMMLNGYLTTIIVALLPPLWHRVMTPKVIAWDRDYAGADELVLAKAANLRSGRQSFVEAAGKDLA